MDQERAVLVGVILPESTADPRDPLGELASLAKTAGARVVGQVLQKKQKPDAGTYIGSGKASEVAHIAKREQANVVLFDNDLSPGQIGTLEKIINEEVGTPKGQEGIKVLDRSELILDIFATRAQTHEAKLQVELAQMQYTYPRLMKMWGHLERIQSGAGGGMGLGTRGPGETQLETDRRLVRNRVSHLRKEIEEIQARKSRQVAARNLEHFTVCVVGYTNAGKSTLFNTLTAAGTYADDKLFATLDTKTRGWRLERGTEVMLSDTVGFVRDLPHNLVASFKATLEEAVHADLLLHVLDVGHPHAEQQFKSVHEVLKDIGVTDKPEILLLNKVDTEEGEQAFPLWRNLHPDAIPVSAKTGQGLDKLLGAVLKAVRGSQVDVTLEADVTNGRLLSFLESHTRIHDRAFTDGRVTLKAVMGKRTLADLSRNEQVAVKAVEAVG
ncbi:MAG: Ribosome LSU-associated GTP-binding protein HflX [uncultured Phycisphaerae bacterium]|uniref:GTPase HflX n=1 Tax=uncultured Phycisphaerae bacterium TaxID=904963 RepID=A0A6J4PQY9_9BACT|nr:MAG: Ribosome LSU-associated GTP-binding protein HflX [uncultured Phycisphaerae bacterium]